MAPDKRRCICPGSYDPITNGHLDIIGRAAELFDEVIVAVVDLPFRKGETLFTAEDRVGFLDEATERLSNVRSQAFSNLVVDFAREVGAQWIVKGLRTITDFGNEFEMYALNRRQAPEIESVYLMASPQYSFLSSSGVKELAKFGGDIHDLVPDGVSDRLQEALGR